MKNFAFALVVTIALCSCTHALPDKSHSRDVFDARGLKVITSFANRRLKTISVLYGNQLALQSAASNFHHHSNGEVFKLVTFKQANNTYWYGSYINGAVKSIETLKIINGPAGTDLFRYTYHDQGGLDRVVNSQIDTTARIANILSHRPLVFP